MTTPSTPAVPPPSDPALLARAATPAGGNRLFWPFQCLFWLLITGFSISMSWAVEPATPIAWTVIVVRMVSGFLITAAVNQAFQRPELQRLERPIRWSLICLATVGLLVGSLAVLASWATTSRMVWMGSDSLGQIVPRLAVGVFWCSGYFAIDLLDGIYSSEIRLAQAAETAARQEARAFHLEATAYEHEVHRLQAQMNPHFLFNALNAIVACKHSPDDVARVTQDLADFLRSALRDSRLLEPLWREIQTLEKYLAVQQARFGSKLDCRIVCERAARGVMVPPLMIQPLLENAVGYGMQTSDGPLRVEVSARVAAGQLEVVVANTGSWIQPDPARSPGTGLETLRKRLALLIGSSAEVTVEAPGASTPAGHWAGVRVVVRLPAARSGELPPITSTLPQAAPA